MMGADPAASATPGCGLAPSGAYADVCGTAGDKFVSLRLPFGSYVPGQPAIDIDLQASLSQNADITPDLLIYYRGGYMFGETPVDDFCCGRSSFSSAVQLPQRHLAQRTCDSPGDDILQDLHRPHQHRGRNCYWTELSPPVYADRHDCSRTNPHKY